MRRRFDHRIDRWSPLPLDGVAAMIDGTTAWLSGGVALDHWHGQATRSHADIDVSVTLDGWDALWARLRTDLHAYSAEEGWLTPSTGRPARTTWLADADGDWCLQVNIEAGDTLSWRYQRQELIVLPWSNAVLDIRGIRTGAPEVQLLWKCQRPAPKDVADLQRFVPLLSPEQAEWLRRAAEFAHPDARIRALLAGVPLDAPGRGPSRHELKGR